MKIGTSIAGNFNGGYMVKDEATGFLRSDGNWSIRGFTPDLKTQFINALLDTPILSVVARKVGIHYNTFRNHYNVDTEFKEKVDYALKEGNEFQRGDFESKMLEHGKKVNGFMWAMSFLRNRFPGEYSDVKHVQHNVNVDVVNKLSDISKAIDVEPISETNESASEE